MTTYRKYGTDRLMTEAILAAEDAAIAEANEQETATSLEYLNRKLAEMNVFMLRSAIDSARLLYDRAIIEHDKKMRKLRRERAKRIKAQGKQ